MRHFQILGNGSSIHFLFWSFITFALGEGVRNWKTGKWDDIDNLSTWKWWNCRTFPTNITYPHTHTCISIYINIYIYIYEYISIYLFIYVYISREDILSSTYIFVYIEIYISAHILSQYPEFLFSIVFSRLDFYILFMFKTYLVGWTAWVPMYTAGC